jgi:hypothetical protein
MLRTWSAPDDDVCMVSYTSSTSDRGLCITVIRMGHADVREATHATPLQYLLRLYLYAYMPLIVDVRAASC